MNFFVTQFSQLVITFIHHKLFTQHSTPELHAPISQIATGSIDNLILETRQQTRKKRSSRARFRSALIHIQRTQNLHYLLGQGGFWLGRDERKCL
jgi:hypothetical protein